MPNQNPTKRASVKTVVSKPALPMPKYEYQVPVTGSMVIKYEDVKSRDNRKKAAPSLHNLRLALA